jgi:hypothetical protein
LDNRLLAPQTLKQLTERASQAAGERVTPETFLRQQRWAAAAHYARLATELAPPLAWAWDLLGYCHERDGAIEEARDCYRCGLECSIFTDQTVRVRTHGFNGDGQKFSAARLQVLGFEPRDAAEREYFECLCLPQPDVRRDRIRELFAQRASAAHGGEAHELWQRAGWDLGAEPMAAFAELLEGVAAAAAAAGRGGQSELAHTHRACFRQRYGL